MKKSLMIKDIIIKMITYFGNNIKRINHALKVYGFVKAIGEEENIDSEKLQVLEVAAILHDIGIKESERKYNSHRGVIKKSKDHLLPVKFYITLS